MTQDSASTRVATSSCAVAAADPQQNLSQAITRFLPQHQRLQSLPVCSSLGGCWQLQQPYLQLIIAHSMTGHAKAWRHAQQRHMCLQSAWRTVPSSSSNIASPHQLLLTALWHAILPSQSLTLNTAASAALVGMMLQLLSFQATLTTVTQVHKSLTSAMLRISRVHLSHMLPFSCTDPPAAKKAVRKSRHIQLTHFVTVFASDHAGTLTRTTTAMSRLRSSSRSLRRMRALHQPMRQMTTSMTWTQVRSLLPSVFIHQQQFRVYTSSCKSSSNSMREGRDNCIAVACSTCAFMCSC